MSTAALQSMVVELLKIEGVCELTQLSRSQVYALAASGAMPAPRKIGRSSRWRRDEICRWIEDLPSAGTGAA